MHFSAYLGHQWRHVLSVLTQRLAPTQAVHRQRGALLIELAVVISLLVLMAGYAVSALNQRHAELRIQALALWMGNVHTAFKAYLNDHGTALGSDPHYRVAGVSQAQQPSVLELKNLGYLRSDFSLAVGHKYQVQLRVWAPSECSPSACAVYGIVWAPAVVTSHHDFAYWRLNTNAAGFIVTLQQPMTISSVLSALTNPPHPDVQPLPVGSLGFVISPDMLGLDYLQVRDRRNPDFQHHVSIAGELRVAEVTHALKGLSLANAVLSGSACTTPGLLGRNIHANTLLICTSHHVWQAMGAMSGGTFTTSASGQCYHPVLGHTPNPYTQRCTCPSGFDSVRIGVGGSTPEDTYLTYACTPVN
ncbi:MAG TPA: type II secretion system protein [Paenalcaligenes sp.]|nr:type II secretion system protein [Paenalcaligenes sp.]